MINERIQPALWQTRHRGRSENVARRRTTRSPYLLMKRALDVSIALFALVFLAPLLAAIAIAIKIDSPGPLLYIQRRAGLHGRLFRFYKFRSMTNGHDHAREHRQFAAAYINGQTTHHQQDTSGQTIFKPVTNGHTVTRVGRWLRSTSLDELPQLLNVIKGDMSLVGPRPSIDYEVAMYSARHAQRLAVVPGITGWAQINGRSSLSFDEIVELDLSYINRRSLSMDLRIMLVTLPMVVRAEHAG